MVRSCQQAVRAARGNHLLPVGAHRGGKAALNADVRVQMPFPCYLSSLPSANSTVSTGTASTASIIGRACGRSGSDWHLERPPTSTSSPCSPSSVTPAGRMTSESPSTGSAVQTWRRPFEVAYFTSPMLSSSSSRPRVRCTRRASSRRTSPCRCAGMRTGWISGAWASRQNRGAYARQRLATQR